MKPAVTLDVNVPESRELHLVLPPDVPAGVARIVVLVGETEVLTEEQHAQLWRIWMERGPQGAIGDEEAGLPRSSAATFAG
ncbi:MAG: hypothetical protein HY744_15605 [Deltaproteobacteria bacterium]|nr:hypothetical protein [Deltaproteobacteria bacterium]